MKTTIGGERLGSGNKMTVDLPGFGRSTHDIGFIFKTDQAIGTIVPYFCDIATNGTTYEMDINVKDRTLPTASAPFVTMKHQVDVFAIPLRLYMAELHNNTLGIGLNMKSVKFPKMKIKFNSIDFTKEGNANRQQIEPDTLLAYTGVMGGGRALNTSSFDRDFPSNFIHAYWDIYKNYYANKQEEYGYMLAAGEPGESIIYVYVPTSSGSGTAYITPGNNPTEAINVPINSIITISYKIAATREEFLSTKLNIGMSTGASMIFDKWEIRDLVDVTTAIQNSTNWSAKLKQSVSLRFAANANPFVLSKDDIKLEKFELSNIDDMRAAVLQSQWGTQFYTNSVDKLPYKKIYEPTSINEKNTEGNASWVSQNGLGLRTYLSDRFNNFLSTEWIDGVNGINEITKVDVSNGELSMDALILQKKLFDMLNRIAISDGSYDGWQEAVYGVKAVAMTESPIFMGGLSCDIVFGEVVSNSASGDEPLGTLAGKGMDINKRGGKIKIKVREPSMIMVLGSIVPRIDYSQGNAWWTELDSMDDLHKPSLDAIGFQDLTTEEFAAWNTLVDVNSGKTTKYGIGKQVSWIQYMTNVNKSYGSFAAGGELSFMAANRDYHHTTIGGVEDATTYIDPRIYNNLFADTRLSAKNIWVQAGFDIKARRVMSAKQIPNL